MKMKKTMMLLAMLLGMAQGTKALADNVINLAGEWQFRIDRDGKGETEGWYKQGVAFSETVALPGSMAEQSKGDDISVKTKWVGALYDSSYFHNPFMEPYRREGNVKLPFFLTPKKHYTGKAWYKRTVSLTAEQAKRSYTLFLERPHIVSEVWVNGVKATSANNNSLSVPHVHRLAGLHEGENTIAICIDNDPETVKVGNDSHSVTDQTQGCWNGIVGRMELRPVSLVESMQVYPDVDKRQAVVKIKLAATLAEDQKTLNETYVNWQGTKRTYAHGERVTVLLLAESFNTATSHVIASEPIMAKPGESLEITLDMGDEMLLWDEFCPQLYRLTAEVESHSSKSVEEAYFGMRKIEIKDKMFYVNGRQIQLRGNVENCVFPLTGYPPTDLDSWVKVFERCKEFGLNHMRFHSYCPPENAFLAADMVGFYIQPEGPSWPNHGVKLGRGEPIDTYLYTEAQRIMDVYGNHPSFTFFAFGNEPAGNWVKWCNDHVPLIKAYDPRHICAGFSVGGGWAWQPKSEFAVKAGARGLAEWARSAPESMADFSQQIAVYNGKDMPGTPITIPFVTHEMGQWCAFPNFAETEKYTGVNKAYNFDIFRDLLKTNGMEGRAHDFLMASGKLQALCYKYETERILRTPKYAGFQLLSINDYSGQGTALVGVTDAFYDDKGYITAPEWREFCSRVVPLAKFPKFTYSTSETFEADIDVAQFAATPIENAAARWEIRRAPQKQGEVMMLNEEAPVAAGDFAVKTLPIGQNIPLGHVSFPLQGVTEAGKYTLSVSIPGTEARNHWDFWVYPAPAETNEAGIYVTDSLDEKAVKTLKKGGKVLICAAGKVTYGKEVVQQFLPVFWNTSWFKMRPPHTTGAFIEQAHPIFSQFPTDYYSDLQWWELLNRAQVMQFTDFPADFQPLVQSIDTWFVSRKIGMLFEAKVGKGSLVMTTMDITNDLDRRLAARQMRQSILSYMQSEQFQPQFTIDQQRIADLFTKVAGDVNMFTNDSPDELKPKLK